jgi:hypothetical protein
LRAIGGHGRLSESETPAARRTHPSVSRSFHSRGSSVLGPFFFPAWSSRIRLPAAKGVRQSRERFADPMMSSRSWVRSSVKNTASTSRAAAQRPSRVAKETVSSESQRLDRSPARWLPAVLASAASSAGAQPPIGDRRRGSHHQAPRRSRRLLGIGVLDHVIVAKGCPRAFRARQLLWPKQAEARPGLFPPLSRLQA